MTESASTPPSHGRVLRLGGFAAAVAIAVLVPLVHTGSAEGARADPQPPYQRQLTAQVQDAAGAPRAGSNPATQRQGSLAAAAGRRQGPGTRTDRPAVGVRTGKIVRQAPAAAEAGVSRSGCAVGYGRPGAQCLPARGPNDTTLTCAFVRTLFSAGIAVTGTDPLDLDTDRDGVACGPRDTGIPPPVTRPPSVRDHPHHH